MKKPILHTLFACAAVITAQAIERPNILVLISDDQNTNTIGCYGAKFKTPNIDRLAAKGVRHTRAYITSSLCVPTRYTDKAVGVMGPRSAITKKHKNVVEQMVVWMDEGIGVILETLEKQGRLDNTLVIFLADQQNTGKSTPYESGNNIAFIWFKSCLFNKKSQASKRC